MAENSNRLRILFIVGTLLLAGAIAAGLYQSISDRKAPPAVALDEVVATELDDIEALIDAEDWSAATERLEVSLKLLPENQRHVPYEMLGRVLARQGRTDEAIAQFRRAISLRPDFAQAHHNLGVAYAERGDVDLAVAELREALRIEPGFDRAQQQLDRLGAEPAAAPAGGPPELDRGRAITRQFYRGELQPIHDAFSETFRAQMSLKQLREMHDTVRRQLGPERDIIHERIGDLDTGWLYVRRARFEKSKGEFEMLVRLDPDLAVGGIMLRPVEPDAAN